MTTATDILDTIRTATEGRDAETLIGLYADDAEVTIVDRSTPPSRPHRLHGRDEIAAFLREGCAREMTHRIVDRVSGDAGIAFTTACRYPDGTRVLCATIAELDGAGRVARQTIVQAWDE
ncbi:MAG: nuclear transport factor 2 family protein [Thermoleophilia bacterium]